MAWLLTVSGAAFGADRLGPRILGLLATLLPQAGPSTLHALHVALRKLGHLFDYAVLGALWWRALARSPGPSRPSVRTLLICVGFAALDELRQGLAPNRDPSVLDVLLDTVGAAVGLASQTWPARAGQTAVTLGQRAALGLGVASLALAAVDRHLGLYALDLLVAGVALLALAGALTGLRRRRATRTGAPDPANRS